MVPSSVLLVLVVTFSLSSTALCRQKRAAFSCSNTGLSDSLRQVFLCYHNDARLRVAKGVESNNVGTLNPAKNMYKLEWDCSMEQQAQNAITTCPLSLGSFPNMAQNLIRYSSSGGFSNPAVQINSTLNSWWGKAKQYGVTDSSNKYTSGNLYTFANMVFAETTKLGCAYKVCSNYLTITCLYNGISSVARGLEPDALGGNAPKAAKMLKMVYDCSVESTALAHASKCVYQHSSSAARPGLGENIYMTSAVNFDKVKAATQASELWWGELKQYGVGPSNNLTTALWNRPNTQIGHYSQMAWETSYRLGCAVAHCSNFTFGVCQYGPAGNYLNRLIYTIGNPCTSNAGCPGSYTSVPMSFRIGLLLATVVACVRSSPIHYDVSLLRTKRDNENATTMATFTVERLDAPIERIEIRLIDENSTNTVLEQPPAAVETVEQSSGNSVVNTQLKHGTATENAIDENVVGSADQYDVRYKKVEYVSDVILTRQDNTPTELAVQLRTDNIVTEEPSSTIDATTTTETFTHRESDKIIPRAEARAWLSSYSTRSPSDIDDDLDVLPPEAEESSSDDEYEPVEECLLNKAELPLKTVQKLTEQARKLGKLIRTRNRLQQQYCINREHPQLNDEFRLCPIWRNEKKVHNYQLMRIKYCADYSKWPNASKLMSTYGDNLNLYETLYAFQKP
ncbi:hypothetical protein RB195_012631 [Necator americanus]|uniref:SCP domain-containing protein n=1 Tax=Necator americanus TaxID=51031 RepID=A0ABR1DUJ6_NECAM